jgi:uncharacterized protein
MKSDILFADALKLGKPNAFSMIVKPTGPVCNLACTYCYYLEKKYLYPGVRDFRMSEELLEQFTRQYIDACHSPVVTFMWQGGEPTIMGIDFFRKAIDLQRIYSGGKKIENAFQTNGTRLTDDWCKFFIDNDILVGISIDGEEHNHNKYRLTNDGSGSFRKTMEGIELLHRHNVRFNTLSCVNNYNAGFAAETYRFLKRIGSGFIQFLPVAEKDKDGNATEWSVNGREYGRFLTTIFDEWVRNDVAAYYVQIFDVTLANYLGLSPGLCVFSEACGDALAIEHNGDVYSCDHFVHHETLLGNIRSEELSDLVISQRQFDFGIGKRNALPQYCLRCDVRYACHGECPKHRFAHTPDGQPGLNYLCEGYRDFFHHVEPYMEFMAKELKNQRPPANVMQWIRNRERQTFKPVIPDRNAPCPCGSGKKFKNCCAGKPLFNR